MLFRLKKTQNNKKNKKENPSLMLNHLCVIFPKNKHKTGGKVSLDTSVHASLTVESAFVLPLYFLCICTLICFMDIYRIQTEHLSKLCQKTKEAAMYAYTLDAREDIVLPDAYRYQIPVAIVPLPDLIMTNRVKVHPWTGYHRDAGESDIVEEMVYVAETGGVYHLSAQCTYLRLSIHQVAGTQVAGLRNQYGEKYHACELCAENQSPGGLVYLTDTGNRYHNLAGCSGLKRTVRLVKKSEVGNLPPCSRCGS